MQTERTNKQSLENSLPEVRESVFFHNECLNFSNSKLNISGKFRACKGKLEVRMPFEKGSYLLFMDVEKKHLVIAKQPTLNDQLPFEGDEWIKVQIQSDNDIPAECRKYCHYDEERQVLVVEKSIPFDYALDYGTLRWCNCTYLQFMTGHRWRFLDRVTGG